MRVRRRCIEAVGGGVRGELLQLHINAEQIANGVLVFNAIGARAVARPCFARRSARGFELRDPLADGGGLISDALFSSILPDLS